MNTYKLFVANCQAVDIFAEKYEINEEKDKFIFYSNGFNIGFIQKRYVAGFYENPYNDDLVHQEENLSNGLLEDPEVL
jgi:hypothetical protein